MPARRESEDEAKRRMRGEPSDDRAFGEPVATRPSEDQEQGESEERESDESGDSGLYGSDVEASPIRTGAAEVVGTFFLVFTGTAVAVAATLGTPIAGRPYESLAVALAFGVALALSVSALSHISGAHFNPAVTLGQAAAGKFPWRSVPVYLAAQLVGATLGALATWAAYGTAAQEKAKLAATYPSSAVDIGQALLVEALVTFLLVFVVVAVATDERVEAAVASFAVGLALAAGVFIAGPLTGGAVNPARALGPMIAAGDLSYFWVYIVGPVVGGVAATFAYDRIAATD